MIFTPKAGNKHEQKSSCNFYYYNTHAYEYPSDHVVPERGYMYAGNISPPDSVSSSYSASPSKVRNSRLTSIMPRRGLNFISIILCLIREYLAPHLKSSSRHAFRFVDRFRVNCGHYNRFRTHTQCHLTCENSQLICHLHTFTCIIIL